MEHRSTASRRSAGFQPAVSPTSNWPYHVGAVYVRVKRLPVTLDAFYVVKHDWSGSAKGESGTGNETRHTLGVFSERPAGNSWDYGLFAAGQLGEYGRDDILGFGVIARGGYTFKTSWKPRVGFEFNYASGDRDPHDGVTGTFDGVFGAMPGIGSTAGRNAVIPPVKPDKTSATRWM